MAALRLASVLLLLSGCNLVWRAPTPMRAIDYSAARPPGRCLVVFLPGMGDEAEDFERHGFVEEVQRRGLSIDIVAADATIGYHARGIFVERLSTDVIAPRRARGYQQLWLIGNSMGGFGSLFYSRVHPSEVTGVLALSPFLGDRDLIDEVYAQGGLAAWKSPPRAEHLTKDNYQRELMRWLQAATRGREPAPVINIGVPDGDKLRRAGELLAAALLPDHVFRTEGKHEWEAWRRLLVQFLDRGPLASSCAPTP
jgi:pimeloyl-ACP methyl ester carboxylesterase